MHDADGNGNGLGEQSDCYDFLLCFLSELNSRSTTSGLLCKSEAGFFVDCFLVIKNSSASIGRASFESALDRYLFFDAERRLANQLKEQPQSN